MGELAALIARTAFPGRVRQFAAADPGLALGLAVGAAWSELPRGGHAVAIVPLADRDDPEVRQALALAARLRLDNLTLLAQPDPDLACEALFARERQPVRLPSLQRSLAPAWSGRTAAEALAETAVREPLLLLPGRDPRWQVDGASLLALAWIAGDGRRVAWELPPGADLAGLGAELDLIGRMQLPLKIIASPRDLPWPPAERGLSRWWVACPHEADAAGVLAWALAGEECVLAALPPRLPAGGPWMPGSARYLRRGEAGTRICIAEPGATAADIGILHLTSLVPPPLAELRAAPKPLLTADEDIARHLAPLAALDPGLRCALAPAGDGPHSRR